MDGQDRVRIYPHPGHLLFKKEGETKHSSRIIPCGYIPHRISYSDHQSQVNIKGLKES